MNSRNEQPLFSVSAADTPLILNVPHAGTVLPGDIEATLSNDGLRLIDTDWHMGQIARGAAAGRATILAARMSRYVVDLNRGREDTPLYAGATTGLVSTIDFDGRGLYRPGKEPNDEQIAGRIAEYWEPYHAKLQSLIDEKIAQHGMCVLLDCHSIRSVVPRLFEGRLPDINIGTNDGASCDPGLQSGVARLCENGPFSHVVNGRFKGGYITRNYGQPGQNVHAVQIEIAQCNYMIETAPWTLIDQKVQELIGFVAGIVSEMLDFSMSHKR